MKEIRIKDVDGEGMTLFEHEGLLYPNMPDMEKRFANLPEFKAKADDVLIVGYPRSGTNWVWEVINMLKTGRTEHIKQAKIECMLEYRDLEHLDGLPSPRVLNTHLLHRNIPPGFIKMGIKMVYVIRNVKDVSVSMYNFQHNDLTHNYNGTWQAYFQLFTEGKVMYDSWFSFVRDWAHAIKENSELPVIVVPYEDLKRNFGVHVRKLATFLDVSYDDAFYDEVELKCNFKTLKDAKDGCYDEEELQHWRGRTAGYLRKGEIGDWKNWYTVAQNEQMDALIEKQLKDFPMKLVYD